LATINRAIQQHRVLAIRYQTASDDEAKPRKIEPYATVLYRGSLYVVATAVGDSSARPPRHWKLDRFLSAEALDQRFKPTRGFDAAQHFQHSLGVFQGQSTVTARIHFEARSALWIRENPWSERQEIEALPNGGLVLTVFDAYETELMPRILALGDSATVLEPESLRIQIIEALESTRKRYG
jgi:predicted DNA-binding transcriptional regulator YafY